LDTLLREQDLDQLTTEDISCTSGEVALELGVLTRGETTKSGTSQGVVCRHWLTAAFFRNAEKELPPGAHVFGFKIEHYQKAVKAVLSEDLPLEELGGTPHLFRHSGANHLLHIHGWKKDKVQERLRHGHPKSTAHYMKRHLLIKNQSRLSSEEGARGQWLWEDPAHRLGLVDFRMEDGDVEEDECKVLGEGAAEPDSDPEDEIDKIMDAPVLAPLIPPSPLDVVNLGAYPDLEPAPIIPRSSRY